MKQSRAMSLVEAIANVAVGYGVAVVTQILIFPVFGLHTTLAQNLKMGAVFTVLCGAPHNTVYAERMIMRSSLWLTTAMN
jgi:hypothetical protein